MKILAIDPGFDVTGWAFFSWDHRPLTLQDALDGLKRPGEISTATSEPLEYRLASIGFQASHLVGTIEPDAIVVEMPTFAGSYTGGRERRAGVNKLYMAIGALLSHFEGAPVFTRPAIKKPKAERHELLALAARSLSFELPTGPRGGERQDMWDAIWLGCEFILDHWFVRPEKNHG